MSRLGVAGAAGGRAPLAAVSSGGVAIPGWTEGVVQRYDGEGDVTAVLSSISTPHWTSSYQ
jgi:hypothetical protein